MADTDNVVRLGGITKLDLDPDRVLNKAVGKLDRVVVIGYKKDGDEYFASSIADGGTLTWLMDRTKHKLMQMIDDES